MSSCAPPPRKPERWRGPAGGEPARPDPQVRRFDRDGLDLAWRRLSYTALTRGKDIEVERDAPASPSADALTRDVDGDSPVAFDAWRWPQPPVGGDPVPLDRLRGGTEAGTWVHEVFERLDFQPGPDGLLRERAWTAGETVRSPRSIDDLVRDLGARQGITDPKQHDFLVQELPRALRSPLGGPVGGLALGDLPLDDRLDELAFDFTVAHRAGQPWGRASGDALVAALAPRRAEGPFWERYVPALEAMRFGTLSGWFTGAIDLVFRADTPAGPRWFVADYKTNRIVGDPPVRSEAQSRAGHYARDFLEVEMARHNYVLQYHFYLVALHRLLRTRIPGYRYEDHVGGAYYLFVRGMIGAPGGAGDGPGPGVWFDAPPTAVIEALSDAFDTAAAPAEEAA